MNYEIQHADSDGPQISVIIPTTCEVSRAEFLKRALNSVRSQDGIGTIQIYLVCNGNRQDSNLQAELGAYKDVRVFSLKEGNVSKARYIGVRNVESKFYCFLDDDDEFLPGCLEQRLQIMMGDPECDVVVTNGLVRNSGIDNPLASAEVVSMIYKDQYRSFLYRNWFASPASMFRTQAIDPEIFNFNFKYFEWTYLFFLLMSLQKKIVFDKMLTYRISGDNPLSASRSINYALAHPDFLLELQRLNLPKNVKAGIHGKYLTALNARSNIYREQGQWFKAWQAHLSCLAQGGLRYISYTRHLIFPLSK